MTKKRKAAASDSKTKKEKVSKKDSGAPKRPPTAFFVFMEEFRNSFKENFPENKSVAAVGKAGGEKWKSLSDAEKAPYVAKAAKKKADYEKAMEEFSNNTNGKGSTGTTSDKSSTEVHDKAEQEASS